MAEENQDQEQAGAPGSAPLAEPAAPSDPTQALLERMEHHLAEISASLSALERERRHRDFSPLLFIGAILQALVASLLLWVLSDAVFTQVFGARMLVKVAFAGVLQMAALTAFLAHRRG
jgi:hypothetical protein